MLWNRLILFLQVCNGKKIQFHSSDDYDDDDEYSIGFNIIVNNMLAFAHFESSHSSTNHAHDMLQTLTTRGHLSSVERFNLQLSHEFLFSRKRLFLKCF